MENMTKTENIPENEILDFYRLVSKSSKCSFRDARQRFASMKFGTAGLDCPRQRTSGAGVNTYNAMNIQSDDVYNLITREQYGNFGRSSY